MLQKSIVSCLALCLAAAGSARAQVGGGEFREAVEFAREKVYPALVNISVVEEDYRGGRAERIPAAGSGVIVSPAGHVVTNFHVAGKAARIKCTLPSGEMIEATRVAGDPMTDLCVLKLDLEKRGDASVPIPFATIGDSTQLEVGDHVLAVGNPLTLSSSMTLGIVSNTKRVFTDFTGTEIEEFDLDGETTGIFNQWIQHDALILPGNSGGPLVNLKGDVVGINTRGGSGVGFAIPSPTIKHVLNQALTFGEVRRGWMGFSVLPVAKAGLKKGSLVSYVSPGSAAEQAGLQAGDVLLALDGQAADVRFFDEVPLLYQRISEYPAGTLVKAAYRRGGEERETTLEVEPFQRYLADEVEIRGMGLTVRDVTERLAIAQAYPNADGVLVTGVRPGYAFEEAKPGIGAGDVVTAVDGKPVKDVAEFLAVVAEANKKDKYAVSYRSEDEEKVTLIEPKEDEEQPGAKELPKAWLGVKTQVLTEKVADAMGIAGRKGFRVTQVFPWTKAQEGGLQPGDALVAMDGEELDACRPQDAEDLRRTIEDMSIGDEVEFGVIRAGAELKITVELEESPASAVDVETVKQEEFEFAVRETTFMDRVKFKLPKEVEGLLVTEATRGGWAHIAGLLINDLLISINGRAVADTKTFEEVMRDVLAARPKVIQLFVRRGQRTHFVFIEPDWSKVQVAK